MTGIQKKQKETDAHAFSVADSFKNHYTGAVYEIREVKTRDSKNKKLPNPIYVIHTQNQGANTFDCNEVTLKNNLKLAWTKI